jgi:hypothetical protein
MDPNALTVVATRFADIPQEIVAIVLTRLRLRERSFARATCRQWRRLLPDTDIRGFEDTCAGDFMVLYAILQHIDYRFADALRELADAARDVRVDNIPQASVRVGVDISRCRMRIYLTVRKLSAGTPRASQSTAQSRSRYIALFDPQSQYRMESGSWAVRVIYIRSNSQNYRLPATYNATSQAYLDKYWGEPVSTMARCVRDVASKYTDALSDPLLRDRIRKSASAISTRYLPNTITEIANCLKFHTPTRRYEIDAGALRAMPYACVPDYSGMCIWKYPRYEHPLQYIY